MQYKLIDLNTAKGEARVLFAVYGNVDHTGDITMAGAFRDYVGRKLSIPILDQHRLDSASAVVGTCTRITEIDNRAALPAEVRTQFPDATGGAVAECRFNLSTQLGRDIFALVASHDVKFSFGYEATETDYQKIKGERVRLLKRCKLYEISCVSLPANEATATIMAKSGEAALIASIDKSLAELDAALSRRAPEVTATADPDVDDGLADYKTVDDTLMELRARRDDPDTVDPLATRDVAKEIDRIRDYSAWWSGQVDLISSIVTNGDRTRLEGLRICYNRVSEQAGAGAYEAHLDAFLRELRQYHARQLEDDKLRRREFAQQLDESSEYIEPEERKRRIEEFSAKLEARHLLDDAKLRRLAEVETAWPEGRAQRQQAVVEAEAMRARRAALIDRAQAKHGGRGQREAAAVWNAHSYELDDFGLVAYEKELKRKRLI